MTAKKKEKEHIIKEDNLSNNKMNDLDESSNISEEVEIEEQDQLEVNILETLSKNELIEKINSLEEELALKTKELENSKDWKKKFMHLQAEFENTQKRWSKDKNNLRLEYTASVLKKFLPLYDSYKKAINQDQENEGIKQFYNQFLNIFKAHDGAKVMDIKINDQFDYHYHEALSSIERDDLPNNTIIDIIQDGWMIGNDILRYAKVVTSRKPKPPEPEKTIKENEEPKPPEKSGSSEEDKTE